MKKLIIVHTDVVDESMMFKNYSLSNLLQKQKIYIVVCECAQLLGLWGGTKWETKETD